MGNYAIIARTPKDVFPAVGTIVPEGMAQAEDVVTIPLSTSGFDPGEFSELSSFLRPWGYRDGDLPSDGLQLQRAGVV